jgi:putative addiction module component (TIGR02574 family)
MGAARKVIKDALELRRGERAKVAAALIASLDDDRRDADAAAAWEAEIARRVKRVLDGESRGSSWEDVKKRLAARPRR